MPKKKNDKIIWYAVGLAVAAVSTVLWWSLQKNWEHLEEGQKALTDGQKEIQESVKENYKEISGLSARIAKVEP